MKALAVDPEGSQAKATLVEDRAVLRTRRLTTEGSHEFTPVLPRFSTALREVLRNSGVESLAVA